MTKEELEKEAEEKYCNGCKWRIEQCLWAWRKTNGLNEPNEKNCSCKEVPVFFAVAEPREKRIADLEKENAEAKEIIREYYNLKNFPCASGNSINMLMYENINHKAVAFLKE